MYALCQHDSRVNDIHEALDVTVFDEDPHKKFEFLGRVLIPLLSIENGVKKWYTLKDKRCVSRSKGQILLEMSLTYNPIRAGIRTVNPKETMIVAPDLKFKRSVFIRNVNRTKAIVMEFVEGIKFVKSCFQWESVPRSATAFLLFLVITYFFEAYMAPLALLLLLARSQICHLIAARRSAHKSEDEVGHIVDPLFSTTLTFDHLCAGGRSGGGTRGYRRSGRKEIPAGETANRSGDHGSRPERLGRDCQHGGPSQEVSLLEESGEKQKRELDLPYH